MADIRALFLAAESVVGIARENTPDASRPHFWTFGAASKRIDSCACHCRDLEDYALVLADPALFAKASKARTAQYPCT